MNFFKHYWVILLLSQLLLSGCVSQAPYPDTVCLSGNCFSGESTLKFANSGTELTGDFDYGYPQGPVTVKKMNGDSYQGHMNVGVFTGDVVMNTSKGQQNIAYRWGVPLNLRHQRGRDLYTGSFNTDELGLVNLLEYTQGVYKTAQDTVYRGNFSYNGRNYSMNGLATFASKNTSQGKFVSKDVLSNHAELKFMPIGSHYVVIGDKDYFQQFNAQGVKIAQRPGAKTIAYAHKKTGCKLIEQGKGWFIWKKGSCQKGLLSGQSTLYSADGSKELTGVFASGDIVKGEFSENSGKSYVGGWKSFMPHGNGHEKIASNNQYKGGFIMGARHGLGICTSPERKERCEYDEGTRIDQVYVMRIENEKNRIAELKRKKDEEKRRAAAAAASAAASGGKDTTNWPTECIKKLAAIKVCEQIGGWGETICKMTASGSFSTCKIPM